MSLDNPLNQDDSNPNDYVFGTNGEEEESSDFNQDKSATNEPSPDETDSEEDNSEENFSDNSSGLEGEEESGEEVIPIDLETFHKKLTQPFKANGKEYQFDDPEDLLTLAKQGLNYTKKMQEIKRIKPVMHMLEQANLLDPNELAYMIDLRQGNGAALARLVKEKNLNLYEFDADNQGTYSPSITPISEQQLNLNEVIESIRHRPMFSQLAETLKNEWDETSQAEIANHPEILTQLIDHMEDGRFSKVNQLVEKQRVTGRLSGMSTLDAYIHVGNALYGQKASNQPNQSPAANKASLARHKVVAGSKQATKPAKQTINYLAMSDEDFAKLDNPKYQ